MRSSLSPTRCAWPSSTRSMPIWPGGRCAMDARHIPLEIQVEAFERGLIPYLPALRADGAAVRSGSRTAETTSATTPPGAPDLMEHCSELKRPLVGFTCSQRFSHQLEMA